MSDYSLSYVDHNTQFALLFPLRTGLFSVRSGSSTSLPPPKREVAAACKARDTVSVDLRSGLGPQARRRGSSMSELDRVQMAQLQAQQVHEHHSEEDSEDPEDINVQVPHSLTTPRGSGYDTAPHSPAFQRRC